MESRAKDGTLTVMCGGSEKTLEAVRPYLNCIGNKILYMGATGSGQLTKLINQLLFDINAAALAEVLPMAGETGTGPGEGRPGSQQRNRQELRFGVFLAADSQGQFLRWIRDEARLQRLG